VTYLIPIRIVFNLVQTRVFAQGWREGGREVGREGGNELRVWRSLKVEGKE
jgi:hypothetical protein